MGICEDLFYSSGLPAFCPFTRGQCKSLCQFIVRSEMEGYFKCMFGNGKVLQEKSQIAHPFSDELIREIKKQWND